MNIDERLLAYKPISVTLNFDWENTTLDQRVQMRWDYIQEQKKKDPNYVGYDFIDYFTSTHGKRLRKSTHVLNTGKLINTLGQVISIVNSKIFITFGGTCSYGYKVIVLGENNKYKTVKVHRLVACVFIPIPEHLKEIRETIVVNHKDDVKYNNLRSNLEWCTNQENIKKAVETGAISSSAFKFTITRPGSYFGNEYYFISGAHLQECGFDHSGVHGFIFKNRPYLCGTWMIVPKEETKGKLVGADKATVDYIKDPKYGLVTARGSVGTIVSEGPCKGEKFVIYGSVQLKSSGFDPGNVSACILGKCNSYKGCTWVRTSIEESTHTPIGLTEAQKEHIFG